MRSFLPAAIVLIVLIATMGCAAGVTKSDRPMVQTDTGPVTGIGGRDVDEFLGIPYAAPPVGDLRWRPPRPPAGWSAPRDATHYGPRCPQVTTLGVFATPSISEDCLYLNVFAPKRVLGHSLPVVVWIHGGSNYDGSSNDYDGTTLATGSRYGGSDTIVVTLNYRLGLLGFLANSALDAEGHPFGNYGIMDQQAALRWVHHNIAGFGGDPNNVTLAGQSAGAADTEVNVISPRSAGLLHRAIIESTFLTGVSSLPTALGKGDGFAQAAGCVGPNAAACLRALSVPQILQLQGSVNATGPYTSDPIVDGSILPLTPSDAWRTGRYAHIPMLGGHTRDEGNFQVGLAEYFSGSLVTTWAPSRDPMTVDDYATGVDSTYGPPEFPPGTAEKVLAAYPVRDYPTPQSAYDAVLTGPWACEDLHSVGLLSERVPVYDYSFDYRDAPYYFPTMPGFTPSAVHTIDIQFLFRGYHGGSLGIRHRLNAQEVVLSDKLVVSWTNFALTGNPNRVGNSPWPRFTDTAGVPAILSQNVPALSTLTAVQASARYHCDFWNTVLTY